MFEKLTVHTMKLHIPTFFSIL